jgi:probable phosphoglycerate mutase
MTVLFLVRHGETNAVGRKLVGRAPQVPLNPAGVDQAERLARYFALVPIQAVYASPLERAWETAEALAKPHALRVVAEEALTDVEFGSWTGRTLSELRDDKQFQVFNLFRSGTAPPDGESIIDVQARMVGLLRRLAREHAETSVVVVGHADPLRAAVAYFLGVPVDMILRLEIDPGSVSVLDLGSESVKLTLLNHSPR